MREKSFQSNSQRLINVQFGKATIKKKILYFRFSYLYLSLAGNIIVYTPDQGTNREKYFNHIIYQRKDADSGGK